MIVSHRKTVSTPSSPLLLEGYFLEQVEMLKYLDVLLSHNISWAEHVQSLKAVRLVRSSTGDSTMLPVVLHFNSTSPFLSPISTIPQPFGPLTKSELENTQKCLCCMATKLRDSS